MITDSKSFLTGRDAFLPIQLLETTPNGFKGSVTFDLRHEGFIGIPHGGIGMGLCVDLWRTLGNGVYPIDVRCKFGGSGISIGDTAECEFRNETDTLSVVTLTKPGDKTPYLRAEITPAGQDEVPVAALGSAAGDSRDLPYYRNCFVCGHHREIVGLKRRFRSVKRDGKWSVIVSWDKTEDFDRAGSFLLNDHELHPAVMTSILDETSAWGGFMDLRMCGLSTRMFFRFYRPVERTEKLLFVGSPTGIRGNPKAPRFFLADGAAFTVDKTGNRVPAVFARGEWLIADQYTQQIKDNLLPRDEWQWIFEPQ